MKEKQKTVYYCDFCKKYRLTRPSMIKHETSCTLNPTRVCRVRGCEGDCPWCEFSKLRMAGDPKFLIFGDVQEMMRKWWDQKMETALFDAAYDSVY